MIEEFTPKATLPPTRNPATGETTLGRATTTSEQLEEVIRHLVDRMEAENAVEVKSLVHWTWEGVEPTVVVVYGRIEHLNGRPLRVLEKIEHQTPAGATIPYSPERVIARQIEEVAELERRGAFTR